LPPIVAVSAFLPVPGVNVKPAGNPVTDSQAFDLLVAATVADVSTVKPNEEFATSDAAAREVNFGAADDGVTENVVGVLFPFAFVATTVAGGREPFTRPNTVHEVSFALGLHELPPIVTL
jgi:hypothetical protein